MHAGHGGRESCSTHKAAPLHTLSQVLRITPRLNEAVNQEWISDKARFQYDALRYQRLAVPMVKKQGAVSLAPSVLRFLQYS